MASVSLQYASESEAALLLSAARLADDSGGLAVALESGFPYHPPLARANWPRNNHVDLLYLCFKSLDEKIQERFFAGLVLGCINADFWNQN